MPLQPQDSPLGAFLEALHEEGIDFILIGAMAAIRQGAPLMTVDYDFWVRLPERQYVRLLSIIQRQHGTIRAQTLYELSDGTQVNAVFKPTGLRSFQTEWNRCHRGRLEGVPIHILPLERVIASKRAANREKDVAVLPILERTLRLSKRLENRKKRKQKSNKAHGRSRKK
jgi:hypothetical protein